MVINKFSAKIGFQKGNQQAVMNLAKKGKKGPKFQVLSIFIENWMTSFSPHQGSPLLMALELVKSAV